MIDIDTITALQITNDLNCEAYIDNGKEYYMPFTYVSMGHECLIEFMGVPIWDSDNDDREWIGEDDKESLRKYLLRQSKEILIDLCAKMMQVI
jgi:hypothetical protein